MNNTVSRQIMVGCIQRISNSCLLIDTLIMAVNERPQNTGCWDIQWCDRKLSTVHDVGGSINEMVTQCRPPKQQHILHSLMETHFVTHVMRDVDSGNHINDGTMKNDNEPEGNKTHIWAESRHTSKYKQIVQFRGLSVWLLQLVQCKKQAEIYSKKLSFISTILN